MGDRPPGWWETVYDRLRGKEELGRLQPMPAPTPGMTADQPDPAYTPMRNPINVLGERLMNVAEDPRNAWIGLGPAGLATKIPKAGKQLLKTVPETTFTGKYIDNIGQISVPPEAKGLSPSEDSLREVIDQLAHDDYTAGYRKIHARLKEIGIPATEEQVRRMLKERD